MNAEIISVGSELTSGQRPDSNGPWLSRQLAGLGLSVRWLSTVRDDLDDQVSAVRTAAGRAELVIVTGGLGPTQDDLTRQALATAAGVELRFDPAAFDAIRSIYARGGRPMPERNRVQAMFPAGSEPLANACGTAPGIWMELAVAGRAGGTPAGSPDATQLAGRSAVVVALPGVPAEMYRMFEEQVRPRLLARFGRRHAIVVRQINTFGAGESDVEARVMDLTEPGKYPEVGITAHDGTISLRLRAEAAEEAEAQAAVNAAADVIYDRLGPLVFGEGEEELEQAVGRLLEAAGLTIAAAEGGTGGLIARRLAAVPGASGWFRGGLVAYSNEAKRSLLGVPDELLAREGAVSGPVAEAMARACRSVFATEVGVAAVGVAGPGGGSPAKPVGTVWVAVAGPDQCQSRELHLSGSRQDIQSRAAKHALNQTRLWLLKRANR